MSDPRFLQLSHQDLIDAIMQEYVVYRPLQNAEDAADVTIKSQILAGAVTILLHNQWILLRQAFARTADMPFLILLAENHGVVWDAGSRAEGWVKLARASAAGGDYPITAGTVFISEPDTDGNVKRVELLADVTLLTGETFCWGWCEVIELQAETLEEYTVTAADGSPYTVAEQTAGSGVAGNLIDSEITRFEAAPPVGVETVENLSPGYSKSTPHLSATTFTIVTGTNDKLKVKVDAEAATEITLAAAVGQPGAVIAADIQAKLRALGGAFALAYCRYNVTESDYQFEILSGTTDAASAVVVSAAAAHDARAELGFENPIEDTGAYGFTGGADPQARESLRGELLDAIQNPGYGNDAAYKRWAKSLTGVADAKIVGVTGGVYIYPVATDGNDFSDAELEEIKDYIETLCPVHLVGSIIVGNPTKVELYASATLVLEDGYAIGDVDDDVKAAMGDYVSSVEIGDSLATPPPTVRYAKLLEAMLAIPGVVDVSGLLIDDVTPPVDAVNYVVPDDTVAQLLAANISLAT